MKNKTSVKTGLSRRKFVRLTSAALAGITIVPSNVIAGLGHIPPSDKLNIAGIGIGGKGFSGLKNLSSQNIVALCDVDWGYCQDRNGVFDEYPKARKFKDWRVMFDTFSNSFDGVLIATADHTHAIIAAHAMQLGKHVYLEKPMSHSVYESRLLTKLAAKHKVATQMGNQGASGEDVNVVSEWIANNEIGEVTKVDCFSDRPIWPQGLNTPEEAHRIPENLDWDLFIGPAKMRPYNSIYHPWNWRGWWDFGVGALGDMGCHILHTPYVALNLGYPTKVHGNSTLLLKDSAPVAEKVKYTFPGRENINNVGMPEVELAWYDGGILPEMLEGWPEGKAINASGGGAIFHGSKDVLVCGQGGRSPWLFSGRVPQVPKNIRRITEVSHEMDWVRACKESPENRTKTKSDFSLAGPFNEMVVLGVAAVRLQPLNKILNWDGKNMQFTNIGKDETIRLLVKDGFRIDQGHPTFEREWTEPSSAGEFASEIIKHTYHNGYSLPDMPL